MKYRDISIMFGLPPVLGVLRLAADRVADLSVVLVQSWSRVHTVMFSAEESGNISRNISSVLPLTGLTSGTVSSREDGVPGQDGAATTCRAV